MSPPTQSEQSPPSTVSIVIGAAILAVTLGYFIGQGSSLGLFSSSKPSNQKLKSKKDPKKSWPNSYDVTIHPDSSDEEVFKQIRGADLGMSSQESSKDSSSDEIDEGEQLGQKQGELNQFKGNNEECKLVLVVRGDLGMGKGKIAAQCSHATLACYRALSSSFPSSLNPILKQWERMGQAKVVVQAKNEEDLQTLQAQAVSLGLCAQVIHDAGRTQIAAGSATVLGVGPGPKSVVDQTRNEARAAPVRLALTRVDPQQRLMPASNERHRKGDSEMPPGQLRYSCTTGRTGEKHGSLQNFDDMMRTKTSYDRQTIGITSPKLTQEKSMRMGGKTVAVRARILLENYLRLYKRAARRNKNA
ncbi:MAG: hypothetical protein Q9218_007280 [Villophora microphyllina]